MSLGERRRRINLPTVSVPGQSSTVLGSNLDVSQNPRDQRSPGGSSSSRLGRPVRPSMVTPGQTPRSSRLYTTRRSMAPQSVAIVRGTSMDVQPMPGQAINPYTNDFIDIDGDEFTALLLEGWEYNPRTGSFEMP